MPNEAALREYLEKRDFEKTPEPAPEIPHAARGPLIFAIQKHSATRLHYDLRLELDGVLKSWAIPNGPSLNPADKRLAVMTEDHPFLYQSFEGVIPRGGYGAGEMIVWDRGTYGPEKPAERREEQEKLIREGLARGRLTVEFHGEKMKGLWTLIKTSRSPKDWLFFKKTDPHADPDRDITKEDRSVLSGLSIDDLKAGRLPPKTSVMPLDEKLKDTPGARAAPMPKEIEPMAAAQAEKPFSNPRWLYEPKLDGYRVIAFIEDGKVRLASRRGNDSTKQYPSLVAELEQQRAKRIVLDGEVVAFDENGRPSFGALQERLGQFVRHRTSSLAAEYPLVYYVFDLIYLDGYDLRGVQLEQRLPLLKEAVVQTTSVKLVEHVEGDGEAFFEAAKGLGLEGIVAKHKMSLYETGRRSPSWLKIKAIQGDEFVVGGFTEGKGKRADTLGALVLGQYEKDGTLRHVGQAGTGFDDRTGKELRKRLDAIRADKSPFHNKVIAPTTPLWVKPELVAEATFVERTRDGYLRAPVFVRLRSDKSPKEVRRAEVLSTPTPEPATKDDLSAEIESVLKQLDTKAKGLKMKIGPYTLNVTNLDRQYWPSFTKKDLLTYLANIAPKLMPHLLNRPLTLIRFPEGIDGERFYQRHWDKGRPEFVDEVTVYSDHNVGDEDIIMCNNLATLMWMGQMGALEFHSWYSRTVAEPDGAEGSRDFSGNLDNMRGSLLNLPDWIVFDIDPVRPEGAPQRFEREKFKRVSDVAVWLQEALATLGLSCFVKTTGRSGLHVYVPIVRKLDFDGCRAISQTVAQFLKTQHPKEIALEWAVSKRVGEVYVDWNQNVRGKTLASIFSPRATPDGNVSMPLRWDQVGKVVPGDFTMANTVDVVEKGGDPWAEILAAKTDVEQLVGTLQAVSA